MKLQGRPLIRLTWERTAFFLSASSCKLLLRSCHVPCRTIKYFYCKSLCFTAINPGNCWMENKSRKCICLCKPFL